MTAGYKVYKFGGASVKDAESVRKIAHILRQSNHDRLLIVVSAMGKNTNALEKILETTRASQQIDLQLFNEFKDFHYSICANLFETCPSGLTESLDIFFNQLQAALLRHLTDSHDFHYDQTVVFGELIGSAIVSAYLKQAGFDIELLDARQLLLTNDRHRAAQINWKLTSSTVQQAIQNKNAEIILTQGFIGGTENGLSTTLGREGSDYSAAIIAYCVDAEEVTIWKDVRGLLNADPKKYNATVKIPRVSYREAIELAYYGATIIHPNTLKPLQNKAIPLYIRSFLNISEAPSVIRQERDCDDKVTSFIVKDNQMLLSVRPLDYDFMDERRLHQLFGYLNELGMHAFMVQISALSLSICLNHNEKKFQALKQFLGSAYSIKYNTGLQLITVRHYNEAVLEKLYNEKEILLEQRSRSMIQLVVRPKETVENS